MENKKYIYYDFSRLYTRLKNTTPTGIDRVEIRYLKALTDKRTDIKVIGILEAVKHDKCYFLYLSPNHIKILADYIHGRWVSEFYSEVEYLKAIKNLTIEIAKSLKDVNFSNGSRLDQRIIKPLLNNKKNSIYFNASFNTIRDGVAHSDTVKSMGIKSFYLVHDIIPIEFPEFCWKNSAIDHFNRLIGVVQAGGQIITISNHVKEKIESLLKALDFSYQPIKVLQNGTEDVFIKNKINYPSEYHPENQFTFVSTIEPRKNHMMLLNVWRSIIDSGRTDIPKLVIIGGRGWNNMNVFNILDNSPAIKAHVVELNGISNARMIAEIRKSHATLFPSFDEGWGLPIVESMALGIPVICSDIPVHRECSQNLARYIDPIDGTRWRQTILDYVTGSEDLAEIDIKRTAEFNPIRWEQASAKLLDIFDEISK